MADVVAETWRYTAKEYEARAVLQAAASIVILGKENQTSILKIEAHTKRVR